MSLSGAGWIMSPKDSRVLTHIHVTFNVKRDFVAVISRWQVILWKRRPCDRSRVRRKNLTLLLVKTEEGAMSQEVLGLQF